MVFVLDNYDSFTYNLVQYMGELGAEMVVRRNDQLTVEQIEDLKPDRILLSPGPCTPQEAGISIPLIRHFAGKVPILGVCLGHQAIGAAFGGNVVRAPQLMHGKTSPVEHDGRNLFAGLPSPMTCTRYHSLIVAEEGLPRRAGSHRTGANRPRGRDHHGLAPSPLAHRGRPVPPRKRAHRRRQEPDPEFPLSLRSGVLTMRAFSWPDRFSSSLRSLPAQQPIGRTSATEVQGLGRSRHLPRRDAAGQRQPDHRRRTRR